MAAAMQWVARVFASAVMMCAPGLGGQWLDHWLGTRFLGPVGFVLGLVGAIELEPIAGAPTKRAFSAFVKAFEDGYLIRTTGDIIALSPPLIVSKDQIAELIDALRKVLRSID